jgi:hypothetical protein
MVNVNSLHWKIVSSFIKLIGFGGPSWEMFGIAK